MDKGSAKKLIRETFERSFERDRFIYFAKNLLNKIDGSGSTVLKGNHLPDSYKPHIESLEYVGSYEDTEGSGLDVLIVQIKKETSLDRARAMQRNFISWYLNGGRSGVLRDASLVAFVSPSESEWRFSFVKMEYNFVKDKHGKSKVKEEFTPSHRYSFLVGESERSHTAQIQLLPLLENDGENPALAQIENLFNIEVVTKEFFEQYRGLCLDINDALVKLVEKDSKIRTDFEGKNIDTVEFSKILLGQVVFLYFLQKKGWFGVEREKNWGTGPKNFLRQLFKKKIGSYSNFFNDILEPLFYEALAMKRTHDYYEKLDCKIPFLNGGLFDPFKNYDWKNTDILLPNSLFSNGALNDQGDVGTGILDIFDRFNFTVIENEPLEKEVAVDPELLGKVFENLLGIKDHKSKGTYYTPREIVHYMCQESIAHYLEVELNGKVSRQDIEVLIRIRESDLKQALGVVKPGNKSERYSLKLPEAAFQNAKELDDSLARIKVCDPAVGSGAFLVGMMNEIVRIRNNLTISLNGDVDRFSYNFKRHAIYECLHGADIDSGAVEICKLRLWLSLVVDEESGDHIQPLPNLDYKIVTGNSLLGVINDLSEDLKFRKLKDLKDKYFYETNTDEKHRYRKLIGALISSISNEEKGFNFEMCFSEIFSNKNGFDVVISNPPYGAKIKSGELKEIKKNTNDTTNSNSAALFIDLGKNRFVSKTGTLSYIVPKSLLFSKLWFGLMKTLLDGTRNLVDVELAFKRVKLEQVVFVHNEALKSKTYMAKKFLGNCFVRETLISKEAVHFYKAWICDVSKKELELASNLNGQFIYFSDISQTKRGVGLQKIIQPNGDFPIIGGKNIFRYGKSDQKGYLNKAIIRKHSNKFSFMSQPKIISQDLIAHIQNPTPHIKIMSFYDERGNIFGLDTVQNTIITDARFSYEFILGILNSNFISWYTYKFIYCSAIRTMHLDNYYIGKIPIPDLSTKQQKSIIDLVKLILSLTGTDHYQNNLQLKARVNDYERQVNQIVYELYGLTTEGVRIVEYYFKSE
jgi:hypothetical protein